MSAIKWAVGGFGTAALLVAAVFSMQGQDRHTLAPASPATTAGTTAISAADAAAAQRKAEEERKGTELMARCTEGLSDVLSSAQKSLAAGDITSAQQTLFLCRAQTKDPRFLELNKKVDAARSAQLAKAAKEESARRKKEGVRIGMSQDEVVASMWGKPRKVNRTITASEIREQWVYDGGYLYFTNGRLTTIQN